MRAVYFNIPAQGHVNPTLPLLAELTKQGVEVFAYNLHEHQRAIEATGAHYLAYPSEAEDLAAGILAEAGKGNFAKNALMLHELTLKAMPFVLAEIQNRRPDVLIYDSLASWGKIAKRITGLPAVTLITTFAARLSDRPNVPWPQLLKMLGQLIGVYPAYQRLRRTLEHEYHVAGLPLMEALMNTGDLNIVFTAKDIQPNAASYGASYHFIGAGIEPRPDTSDFPLEQLQGKPLVYISMGTINNQREAFYRQCFAAFGGLDGQFVLSVGKATDIASLGAIPANFIVRNFVPQLEILQRADAFLTHGGMNSIHEGFYYGVPMLVLPQQPEQVLNAQIVQQQGAGLMLNDTNPATLQQQLQHLLSTPRYRQRATALGASLRAAGGVRAGAQAILAFIAKHKQPDAL